MYIFITFLFYIFTCIGYMEMFQKAGVPSWYAWIPCFNEYWAVKTSTASTGIYFLYLLYKCSNAIILIIYLYIYFYNYDIDIYSQIFWSFLIFLFDVSMYNAYIIYKILLAIYFTKAFSLTKAMLALMIFCPCIAYMIIGFGQPKYNSTNA